MDRLGGPCGPGSFALAKSRRSAGLLPYRLARGGVELFLVHPGGPFWAKKDAGAWSIAKGEFEEGEDALAAARREFAEETGIRLDGAFIPLDPVKQPGGKTVHAWAIAADFEADQITSNVFTIEWPPRSGVQREFPEVDRAAWLDAATARVKILQGQAACIDGLLQILRAGRT